MPFSPSLRQYIWRNINYCRSIMVIIMISHYAASRGNLRCGAMLNRYKLLKMMRGNESGLQKKKKLFLRPATFLSHTFSGCFTCIHVLHFLSSFSAACFLDLLATLFFSSSTSSRLSLFDHPSLTPSFPKAQWIRGF